MTWMVDEEDRRIIDPEQGYVLIAQSSGSDERRPKRWLLRSIAAFVLTTGCAQAGSSPPLDQTMRIKLQGDGRNISAEFRFVCAKQSDGPPDVAAYRPSASSMLYVADNRQALVITGIGKNSDLLCAQDEKSASDPQWQRIPSLIWIDNVDRPSLVDVVDPTSPVAMRKYHTYSPFLSFNVAISAASSGAQPKGRALALTDDVSALNAKGSGDALLYSPLVTPVSVRLAPGELRKTFEKLLGDEIVPGVRKVNFCSLAHTIDGDIFFRQRIKLPEVCNGSAGLRSPLPANSFIFGNSQPLRYLTNKIWSVAQPVGHAASYIRADNFDGKIAVRNVISENSAPLTFWREYVQRLSVEGDSGRYIFSAEINSAIYTSQDDMIYLILGEIETLHFKNPINWRR